MVVGRVLMMRCPLRSESDRNAAPPRNDVMCQKTTSARPNRFDLGRRSWAEGSALLVWVEDVVLRFHGHMARVSAIRGAGIGRERVGCGVVVEQRVSPSAAVRKSLAVLFHHEIL